MVISVQMNRFGYNYWTKSIEIFLLKVKMFRNSMARSVKCFLMKVSWVFQVSFGSRCSLSNSQILNSDE